MTPEELEGIRQDLVYCAWNRNYDPPVPALTEIVEAADGNKSIRVIGLPETARRLREMVVRLLDDRIKP